MKHTQGNWEISEEGQGVICKAGSIASVFDPNDTLHKTEVTLANAQLIASAPELLEAVTLCWEQLSLYADTNQTPEDKEALDLANELIYRMKS